MNTAKVILISLYAASLLLVAHNHGKERTGKYNFWMSLFALSIIMVLLYFSNFFK